MLQFQSTANPFKSFKPGRHHRTTAQLNYGHTLFAFAIALSFLNAGCGGSKEALRRSNVDVVFRAPTDDVERAFRTAMDEMGVTTERASRDGSEIFGRYGTGTGRGTLDVRIVDDSTGVLARIEGRVDEGVIPDHGFQLVGRVSSLLNEPEPTFRPQRLFPSDSTNCRAPAYSQGEVIPPSLIGEVGDLLRRAGYTKAAREANIEGKVLVAFVVDERGRVPCAMVILGLPAGLNSQAINAVLASDFEAGTVDGVPKPMRAVLPFTFSQRKNQ